MQCGGDDTALLGEPWGVCSACSSPARHNPLISPCAVVLPEGTTIQMKTHIMKVSAGRGELRSTLQNRQSCKSTVNSLVTGNSSGEKLSWKMQSGLLAFCISAPHKSSSLFY